MKFLKKLKSSNFWVSMISAVVLILQAVFNVDIKTEYLNQIILGILGLLVMSGIVTDTNNDEVTVKQSIDIEKVNETINTMFTQISATLQTDITNIMSQFKTLKDETQIETATEIKNEEIIKSQDVANEMAIDVEQVEVEYKNETIQPTQQNVTVQEIDIPKNEL